MVSTRILWPQIRARFRSLRLPGMRLGKGGVAIARASVARPILFLAILSLCALSAATGPARAQGASQMEATLDRNVMNVGDTATLKVRIQGAGQNISDPVIPPVPGLSVTESGRSQNVMIVNNTVSVSLEIDYAVTATRPGTCTVGPITVQVNGTTMQAPPLQLKVVAGGAGSSGGGGGAGGSGGSSNPAIPNLPPGISLPPLPPPMVLPPSSHPPGCANPPVPAGARRPGPAFLTAKVDNPKPFVGQPTTFILRFYHVRGVRLVQNPQAPNTTGFVSRNLPPTRLYQTRIGGRDYTVEELRFALVPTASGTFHIGSMSLDCMVPMLASNGEDGWPPPTRHRPNPQVRYPIRANMRLNPCRGAGLAGPQPPPGDAEVQRMAVVTRLHLCRSSKCSQLRQAG